MLMHKLCMLFSMDAPHLTTILVTDPLDGMPEQHMPQLLIHIFIDQYIPLCDMYVCGSTHAA
jgi:hypothetical protein